MKKISLLTGIKSLLTNYQWSKVYEYERKKLEESNESLNKFKKNLAKGQKVRAKNISSTAKQNKKILLSEAKRLVKLNPRISRKELASELEDFSNNYKINGLSQRYSYSHIYKEILKNFT